MTGRAVAARRRGPTPSARHGGSARAMFGPLRPKPKPGPERSGGAG